MEQLFIGAAGAGLFTLIYKIIELGINRQRRRAETAKYDAEGDKLRGDTWREAYRFLAEEGRELRARVTHLEEGLAEANDYISELLCGIEKLLRQLRRAGVQQPDWTPRRRPRPPVTGYISPPAGD